MTVPGVILGAKDGWVGLVGIFQEKNDTRYDSLTCSRLDKIDPDHNLAHLIGDRLIPLAVAPLSLFVGFDQCGPH